MVKHTLMIATLFLSGNRQWIGGERDIFFHVSSLVGSHGFLPVSNLQSNFGTAGFNISDQLHCGVIFSLGYNVSAGSYDLFSQNVNLGISVPLS